MSLTRTLIKPLLNAQHQKGWEEGREEAEVAKDAQFEEWKRRQEAAGVKIVEENGPDQDPAAKD